MYCELEETADEFRVFDIDVAELDDLVACSSIDRVRENVATVRGTREEEVTATRVESAKLGLT